MTQEQPQLLTPEQLEEVKQKSAEPKVESPAESPKLTDFLKIKAGEPVQHTMESGPLAGKTVTLQKPAKPITIFLATLMGLQSYNRGLKAIYSNLMYVKAIGPTPVPPPDKAEDFDGLLTMLGDDGYEEISFTIFMANNQQEAQVDKEELKK